MTHTTSGGLPLVARAFRGLLPGVLLAATLFYGCFGGGSVAGPPVPDAEALAFAERAQRFYGSLEAVPLAALLTYQDPALQSHFASASAFNDYYSALTNSVRAASMRDGQVNRIEILEFRFEGPDLARVDLRISGRHQRTLRFWGIGFDRTDTWRKLGGTWMLAPDKL